MARKASNGGKRKPPRQPQPRQPDPPPEIDHVRVWGFFWNRRMQAANQTRARLRIESRDVFTSGQQNRRERARSAIENILILILVHLAEAYVEVRGSTEGCVEYLMDRMIQAVNSAVEQVEAQQNPDGE